jgi:hypothetical protein
MPGV